MLEVYPNLFVGSMVDYETIVSSQTGWAIVKQGDGVPA